MSNLPPEWREWIVSNHVRNIDPVAIKHVLRQNNFSEADIDAEFAEIAAHPYVAAYREDFLTLQKREWMLSMMSRKYKAGKKYTPEIDRLPELPSFEYFLKNYLYENKPLLVENGIENWPARSWTPELVRQKIGNPEVEVQYGREADQMFEQNSARLKKTMLFQDFMDEVESAEQSNNLYLTANNAHRNRKDFEILYNEIEQLGDDWLNMKMIREYGFIWIGPRGTFTPTHHDLTDNLFVQIYGRKRFWLAPMLDAPSLYNSRHVYSHAEIARPDFERFPLLKNAGIMQFDLLPGQILYIPIGWWHAVEALDMSISFSSFGFNAPNDYHTTFPITQGRY